MTLPALRAREPTKAVTLPDGRSPRDWPAFLTGTALGGRASVLGRAEAAPEAASGWGFPGSVLEHRLVTLPFEAPAELIPKLRVHLAGS